MNVAPPLRSSRPRPPAILKAWRFAWVALAGLLMCGASAWAQSIQQVAAIVNDDVISTFDLQQRIRLVLASSGVQPTQEIIDKVGQQVLRQLVDERLEMHEAKKNDITIGEDEVTKAIEGIAQRNNLPPGAIMEMLAKANVGEATLRQQIRAELAWNRLMNQRFGSRIFISDEDIDAEMKRVNDSFHETQYLVSEIVLAVDDPKDEADVKATAQRLLEQMSKGASFSAIAQQFSQAPSAATGGDLGWVLPDDLDPELAKRVPTMLPGQVTPPIRTAAGYHILALRSKRTGAEGEPGQITSVTLKQILAPLAHTAKPEDVEAATARMKAIQSKLRGCGNVEAVAQSAGLISSDLGKIGFDKIAPFFRSTVSKLEPGQASDPVQSPVGLHILVMCDREATAAKPAKPPTRQEVEDRLYAEQLSVMARRYLRDLRRDAVIEYR